MKDVAIKKKDEIKKSQQASKKIDTKLHESLQAEVDLLKKPDPVKAKAAEVKTPDAKKNDKTKEEPKKDVPKKEEAKKQEPKSDEAVAPKKEEAKKEEPKKETEVKADAASKLSEKSIDM